MATLSLSLIVGNGRAKELERCLESAQGLLFDERVICLTSGDEDVARVAKRFATKVISFPWIEDFGAARNASLDACSMSHVMWLDSDDVIKPEQYKKLEALKLDLDGHDVVWITYNYSHDQFGNPDSPHPRERIVRRLPEIRWLHPIHECLSVGGFQVWDRTDILIDHFPDNKFDSNPHRNLKILERVNRDPNCDIRMRYYYAKELLEQRMWDTGVPLAEGLLQRCEVVHDEAVVLARQLAFKYHGDNEFEKCKAMCLSGIGYSPVYAELYCLLGDIAQKEKQDDEAIRYYTMAMACRMEGVQGSWRMFYYEVPARNLYLMHSLRGEFIPALLYNKFALDSDPESSEKINTRRFLWDKIMSIKPVSNLAETTQVNDSVPVIAWLIPSVNLDDPSTRIRRYNPSLKLKEMGIDSFIVHDYYRQNPEKTMQEIRDANVVIFSQCGDVDYGLIKRCKAAGKRVVYDNCELLFSLPMATECMNEADALVCCSTLLGKIANDIGIKSSIEIIKDAYEVGA